VSKTGSSRPLATRVRLADRFWLRARGLLGRPRLAEDEGLLLRPCRAVHTWGMRYPIDVAFLDPGGTVLASYPSLAPSRRTRRHSNADCALELPAGALARSAVRVGDRLRWETIAS
jgi:uncharacterized membrane protein (UPF0127 family)